MHRSQLHLIRAFLCSACLLPNLLWGASQCDDSSTEALALLERMSRSGVMVSHQGMATLQRDGDMRVLQIHRNTQGDATTETLTLLTGQSARIVRSAHADTCVHPGQTLLRLRQEEGNMCGVAVHYRLALETGDLVADRITHRIIAQPRDMYRYAHVLEIDAETAQLLKVTTLTADGRPLEQFQYASLALEGTSSGDSDTSGSTEPGSKPVITRSHIASHPGGGDDEGDDAKSGDAPATGLTPELQRDSRPEWKPEWLPAGFVATQTTPNGMRQTYTDGMASFSVFLEPMGQALQAGEGAVREGSTLAYTRGMAVAGSMVLVTVIGEVPVNTARIVADSVRLR
ncbi:MAG: MucB/RseB C-terminal domain-containing protein [Chromatocurvus sp.]